MKNKFKAAHLKCSTVLLAFIVNICFLSSASANSIIEQIEDIEHQLGARIGVSVYDIKANVKWNYNGDANFPLMSTFKTLACANLLADVDKGSQSFDVSVVVNASSLISWSPVTEKLMDQKITLLQACSAAMIMSDNTAANIVLASIKGPRGLTQFMRSIGDKVTRLDRIEPDLNQAHDGDKRDTTTPNAMVMSLHKLLFGTVLSQASKVQLKQWMMENKVANSLLRSVLPENWSIADRSGAGGYGSRGITALVWSDNRSPIIISIYLTQTEASFAQRNNAIAEIGKEIFSLYNNERLTGK